MIKQTVLYDKHVLLIAKMAPVAGYMMPMYYSGIINELSANILILVLFLVSKYFKSFIKFSFIKFDIFSQI